MPALAVPQSLAGLSAAKTSPPRQTCAAGAPSSPPLGCAPAGCGNLGSRPHGASQRTLSRIAPRCRLSGPVGTRRAPSDSWYGRPPGKATYSSWTGRISQAPSIPGALSHPREAHLPAPACGAFPRRPASANRLRHAGSSCSSSAVRAGYRNGSAPAPACIAERPSQTSAP